MGSARPSFLSRASSAFSSLAVTVAVAVLTILVVALGTVQDSKAESFTGSIIPGITKVEDPSLEWAKVAVGSLPERSVVSGIPASISRTPLAPTDGTFIATRTPQGPTQEWMGVSKLAFPLLVGDLVGGQAVKTPRLMTGRTVGVVN
jgi:hypothetical protein